MPVAATSPLLASRLSWTPECLARWSREQAVACARAGEPLRDEAFGLFPTGDSAAEAYLRASDPSWWRRAGARRLRIAQEAEEHRQGLIGKDAQWQYTGGSSGAWEAHRTAATEGFLKHTVVYDPVAQSSLPLSRVVRTPEMLAARYYSFLRGIQTLADESGLRWAMLTITLPPEWHARPANRRSSHVWNGETADTAHSVIATGWRRVRALLAKQGITLTGVRTEEPMQDGTPHWHCAFFFKDQAELDAVCAAVLRHFPAGLRLREGRTTHTGKLRFSAWQYDSLAAFKAGKVHRNVRLGAQCQIDIGTAKTGDARSDRHIRAFASYVLKYVTKSCGVRLDRGTGELVEDPSSITESGTAARVREHRSTYGIRGIEFYGIPKGAATCWDLLRQVVPSPDLGPLATHLAGIVQLEKGQGFAEYVRLLGGVSSAPCEARYRISPLRVETVTRYQGKGVRLVGVEITDLHTGAHEVVVVKTGERVILRDTAADALAEASKRGELGQSAVFFDEAKAASGGLVQIGSAVTSENSQLEAAHAPVHGSYTVLAAAGSGKTFVLVERAKYLVSQGVKPASIALAAFTRASAAVMRSRLDAAGLHGVESGTMHSLSGRWSTSRVKARGYDEALALSSEEGKKDRFLLVDEAQDLSPDQWRWVKAHARHAFVVGDFRQAIYGWRGAARDGLMEWARQTGAAQLDFFADSTLIELPYNRRSGAPVVALGNALQSSASPSCALHLSGALSRVKTTSDADEVEHLAAWAETAPASAAVLARTNAEVAHILSRFTLRGLKTPVMTVHEAKGLEWDAVALACGKRKPSEVEEDSAQVFYVAATRAARSLHIVSQGQLPRVLESAIVKFTGWRP